MRYLIILLTFISFTATGQHHNLTGGANDIDTARWTVRFINPVFLPDKQSFNTNWDSACCAIAINRLDSSVYIWTGHVWLLVGGGSSGVGSFNGRVGAVVPVTGDYTFAQIVSTPTTVAGYGITDVWTKTQADARYLQSYTETDPVFLLSVAHNIAALDTTHWHNGWTQYTVSGSFGTGTGIVTYIRNDGSTWAVNIDGRYLTTIGNGLWITGGTTPAFDSGSAFSYYRSHAGIITGGVWMATAVGDAYIASASNWNQAYNKYLVSGSYLSGTLTLFTRDGNSWSVGGFNVGTVTSFSAGNLSPLFTTSVGTSGTTPALTFALSNVNPHLFLAGATSGTTTPTYRVIDVTDINSGTSASSSTFLRGDWTWAAAFVLSTTGSSGSASFSGGTLNIPTYTALGLGALAALTTSVNTVSLATGVNNTITVPAATGVTGLGTGVATWWQTPSSANLGAALTDETGSGHVVFDNKPTFLGTISTITAMGAQAVDGSLGNFFTRTLASSETFTQSNISTNQFVFVEVKQGSGTSYTVTWFSGITWVTSGGTAPVQTTTSNGITTYAFRCTGSNTFIGYLVATN